MAKNPQKLAAAALLVLRLTRGRLGTGGVIGLLIAAALYVLLVQPWAAERWGVDLPTLDQDPPAASRPADPDAAVTAAANEVLTPLGRDRFRSPAGLVYTRGSQHGHRLKHLMHHAEDNPSRAGPHGVFDASDRDELVLLVDEAYRQALDGRQTRVKRQGERVVYEVDLGRRIGYVGGETGARRGRPPAEHLRLVVQGDRLITAFPFVP